jgi:hypothetical protein
MRIMPLQPTSGEMRLVASQRRERRSRLTGGR